MEKHWSYSKHFGERFFDRFNGDKTKVQVISKYFNNNVLQLVYDCNVRGDRQRVKIDDYIVCYRWDPQRRKIIVTTVF